MFKFRANYDLHIPSFTIANDDTYKTTLQVKIPAWLNSVSEINQIYKPI